MNLQNTKHKANSKIHKWKLQKKEQKTKFKQMKYTKICFQEISTERIYNKKNKRNRILSKKKKCKVFFKYNLAYVKFSINESKKIKLRTLIK